MAINQLRRKVSEETSPANTLILVLWPPGLWDKKCLPFCITHLVVLCDSSPRELGVTIPTILKCTIQLVSSKYSTSDHHYLILEHFQIPKGNIVLFSPTLQPWQPLTCFLLPWVCLFWTWYIYGIIQYEGFGVLLLSLCIILLRFIHVVACISTSFLYIAECSTVYIHILFIHSSTGGHLSGFHIFPIENSCTYFIWTPVFNSLGHTPRRTVGSCG